MSNVTTTTNQGIAQKSNFGLYMQSTNVRRSIDRALQDPKKRDRYIAAITSAVVNTPALQKCDFSSIVTASLVGEALNLSPSPQLGQYYMVPFKSKAKFDKQGNMIEPESTKAQFVLGYKGYIQLAIRSGRYKHINVVAIKKGELIRFDPLTEEIELNLIMDDMERESTETTGYCAMFEYTNGFRKAMYWSKEKMLRHADKFSRAFSAQAYKNLQEGKIPEKDMWKYSSFWYKDFDGMAFKTMLRQLISKWGVMSTEMQMAYSNDGAVIARDGTPVFDDPEPTVPQYTPRQADPMAESAAPKRRNIDAEFREVSLNDI